MDEDFYSFLQTLCSLTAVRDDQVVTNANLTEYHLRNDQINPLLHPSLPLSTTNVRTTPLHPDLLPPCSSCLLQVPGVSLDGLLDAEQHRGQPLVQTGHRIELLHGLREGLAVLLLVGFKEFLLRQNSVAGKQKPRMKRLLRTAVMVGNVVFVYQLAKYLLNC